MYKCVKCKKVISAIEGTIRCPFCGARVLIKMRPQVTKRVQTR